jgi:hypothetical protein
MSQCGSRFRNDAPPGTAKLARDLARRWELPLGGSVPGPEHEEPKSVHEQEMSDAQWHEEWKAKMKAKMDAEAAAPRPQLPVSQAALDLEEEFRRKPVFQPYVDPETGLTIDQELDDNG